MRISIAFAASIFTLLALVGCNESPAPNDKNPANVAADKPGNKTDDKPADQAGAVPADKSADTSGEKAAAPTAGGPESSPAAPAPAPAASAAGTTQLDLRFAPKEAFAAFVAFPRRVLNNGELAKADLAAMFEPLQKHLGFTPREVEQVMSFAVMTPAASPQSPPNFGGGAEIVVSQSVDQDLLLKSLLEPYKAEVAGAAGQKYFRAAKDPTRPTFSPPPPVAFIDDHTFIVADEPTMKLMLGAARQRLAGNDTQSPLTALVGKLDPKADLAVVAINPDEIRKLVDATVKAGAAPPALAPYAELPDLVQSTTLTINTQPELGIHWLIEGRDEASAKKIADMIAGARQMANQMLPAFKQLAESRPPEIRPAADYAVGLATKLAAGITPKQTGNQVTLDIQNLGTVDDLATKMIAPGIVSARTAARRMQRMNDLKQLALAMQVYAAAKGTLPPAAIYSKDGKPLLSWRVAVLPYLEQANLYKAFHLDEPWDGPNNKQISAVLIALFVPKNATNDQQRLTRYVVPTGKGTIFDGNDGIKLSDMTDRLSNTIMIVEVGPDKAVAWAAPEDMAFDPEKPAAGLGEIPDEGFLAAFADGSVRLIKKSVDPETLRRLFIRNDGQPIDPEKF